MGTVDHEVFQAWIEGGFYLSVTDKARQKSIMKALYDEAYWRHFSDTERYDEGLELAVKWLERQDWKGRVVLSTEQKLSHTISTSVGPIPWNYIMDRVDRLDNGDIEVVDYKSLSRPMPPEALKHKLQARSYGAMAGLMYPDAQRIWVTFDMLRYEPVGVVFTKEENRDTLKYIHALAERIIADDEAREQLGTGCRYCVRKSVCESLQRHVNAGGPFGITDPVKAVTEYYKIKSAVEALKLHMADLNNVVLTHLEDNDEFEMTSGDLVASVKVSGRRVIDPERVLSVVGPTIFSEYAGMGVGDADKLLKDKRITDDQKSQLRQLFRKNYGDPYITVDKVSPF